MAIARGLLIAALTSFVDCARLSKGGDAEGVGIHAQSLWNDYVAATTAQANSSGRGLQTACQPQMHQHEGTYRGVAMLLHGFTACPQQFEQLIPLLTGKGFAVYVPVLPGHGYNYLTANGINDYTSDLPKEGEEYRVFAQTLHEIMQASEGTKVLFGNSLGGGIAAHMGWLGGYDRRLLSAPMILPAGLLHNAISLANRYPWRRHQRQSWGEGCEIEREEGRAGICHFTAAIGAAARDVGQDHSYSAKITEDDIQIIFVEDDAAVSTNAVINLGIHYGIRESSSRICGMDARVGHSFLSPYDNPLEDKYWLEDATHMVADYLADGVPVPQGVHDKAFGSTMYARCDIPPDPSK